MQKSSLTNVHKFLTLAMALLLCSGISLQAASVFAVVKATSAMPSDDGNLHADFKAAIANQTLVVYPNALADTALRDAGNSTYYDHGATTNTVGGGSGGRGGLFRFDLSVIPGFHAGTVIRAEMRVRQNAGNGGDRTVAKVITHAWSEGNKVANFPGVAPAARGASFCHPNGLNTKVDQDKDGGVTGPLASWGPNSDSRFDKDVDTAGARFFKGTVGGTNPQWVVFDITDLVTEWHNGTAPNYGVYLNGFNNNYQYYLREYGSATEPVLFIEYDPPPVGTSIIIR